MEAKDTVLSNGKLLEIFGTPNFTERQGREKQAEISFEAGVEVGYQRGLAMKPNPDGVYENGRQEGRREVVEFYKAEQIKRYGYPLSLDANWQAKLKEWEINQLY